MENRILNDDTTILTTRQSKYSTKNQIGWRFDSVSKIKFLKRLKLKKKKDQPMVMLERLEHRLSARFVKELYKNKSLKVLQKSDGRPKPKRKKELFQIVDKQTYEAKQRAGSSTHNTRGSNLSNLKQNLATEENSIEMVGELVKTKFKTLNNKNSKESKETVDRLGPKVKIVKEGYHESKTKTLKTQEGANLSNNEPSVSKTSKYNKGKLRESARESARESTRESARESARVSTKESVKEKTTSESPASEKISLAESSELNGTKMKLLKNEKVFSSKMNTAPAAGMHTQQVSTNTTESNNANCTGDISVATGYNDSQNNVQTLPSPPSNPSPDSSSSKADLNTNILTSDEEYRCSVYNNGKVNCDSTMQDVIPTLNDTFISVSNAKIKDYLLKKTKKESGEDSGIPKIVLYLRGDGPDKQYRCENRKSQSDTFLHCQMNAKYVENKREIELFGEDSNDKALDNNENPIESEVFEPSDSAIFSDLEEYKNSKLRNYNSKKEPSKRLNSIADSLPELEDICDDDEVNNQKPEKFKVSDRVEFTNEEGNTQIPWFPKEDLASSKSPKISLAYKNTGKPTAHVEPYIAEPTLRQCSRKGRGFYDENIPFLEHEDLELAYENSNLDELKQIVHKTGSEEQDNLRELDGNMMNIYANDIQNDHNYPSSSKSRINVSRTLDDEETNYESQLTENYIMEKKFGKYENSSKRSKFLKQRRITGSYCTGIMHGDSKQPFNSDSNPNGKSWSHTELKTMVQLRKSPWSRSYSYLSKTTNKIDRTRRRSLSIDSTLSLFKVRIDNSALKHSSQNSISLPNLTYFNSSHLLQQETLKNGRRNSEENQMLHHSNEYDCSWPRRHSNYQKPDIPHYSDSNYSENTAAESHASDNQTSGGSNISDSDSSSEISEDSLHEHNSERYADLFSSRNAENTMYDSTAPNLSDRSVPFDSQYEVVWGNRTKRHKLKLERRLLKIRAYKRIRNEEDEEKEKMAKSKENRKRSREEGNVCVNDVADKHLRKNPEGDRGRRLAQEIPGFNWLEEKIRNTSTVSQLSGSGSISSPTVSTSTCQPEEPKNSNKLPSRSLSCPTVGAPKPIPALIPSNEFISSVADASPASSSSNLKRVSKVSKDFRKVSVTEKETPEIKRSDSPIERSTSGKGEELFEKGTKTSTIKKYSEDSPDAKISREDNRQPFSENMGSMTKQLVEGEASPPNASIVSLDKKQVQAALTSKYSHLKKKMESVFQEEKETSKEELTTTSPKRFHIQTAVPPLVPTSKVTALPKRQILSPPQQSNLNEASKMLARNKKSPYQNQQDILSTTAPMTIPEEPSQLLPNSTNASKLPHNLQGSNHKYANINLQNKATLQSYPNFPNHRDQVPIDNLKYYDRYAFGPNSRGSEVLPKFLFQGTQPPKLDHNKNMGQKMSTSHTQSSTMHSLLKPQKSINDPALYSQNHGKPLNSDLKTINIAAIQRCMSSAHTESKTNSNAPTRQNYENSQPLKQNTRNNYLIPLNKIKSECRNSPYGEGGLRESPKLELEVSDVQQNQRNNDGCSPKLEICTETTSEKSKEIADQKIIMDESKMKHSSSNDYGVAEEVTVVTGEDQDNASSAESSPQSISVSQKLSILTQAFKSKLNTSLGLSPEAPEEQTEPGDPMASETPSLVAKFNDNLSKVEETPLKMSSDEGKTSPEAVIETPSPSLSEEPKSPDDGLSRAPEPEADKEEKPVLISIPETLPSFASVLNGMKMSENYSQSIFGKETKNEAELPNSLIVALYEELMRTRQEVEKLRKVQEQMLMADKSERKNRIPENVKPNTSPEPESALNKDPKTDPTPVVIDITNLADTQETLPSEKATEINKNHLSVKAEQELKFVYEVNNERLKRSLHQDEQAMAESKRRKSEEDVTVNSAQDNTITIRYNIPENIPVAFKTNPTDNIKLRNLLGISNNELDVVPVEESVQMKSYNDNHLRDHREHMPPRPSKQELLYNSATYLRENERGRELYSKMMESQSLPRSQPRHSLPDLPNLIPSGYPSTNVRQRQEPSNDQRRESHLMPFQMAQHNTNSRPIMENSHNHPQAPAHQFEGTRIYNPSDNTYHLNGTKLDVLSVSEPQPLMSHHSIPIISQSQRNYANETMTHQAKYQHSHEGEQKGPTSHFSRDMDPNPENNNEQLPTSLPTFQPKILISSHNKDVPNVSSADWHHPQSPLHESRQTMNSQSQMHPSTSATHAQKPTRMSAFSNPNYVYRHPNGAQLAHIFPVNAKPASSPPSKQPKLYNTLHQMQQESAPQGQQTISNSNLQSPSSSTHVPSSSPMRYADQQYHPSQHQMQQSSSSHSMPAHPSQGHNQQHLNSNYLQVPQHRQIAATQASAIQEALQKSYQPVLSSQMMQHRPPHPSSMGHPNSQMHPVYVSSHTNISHRLPNSNRISPHRLSPQQSQQIRGPGPAMPQTSQMHHANQPSRNPSHYQNPPPQPSSGVPHQFKPIQPRLQPPPPYPHMMAGNQSLHKAPCNENALKNQALQMEMDKANNEAIEQANLKKDSSPSSSSKKKCLICPQAAQFLCSGCKTAWYCSKECQREHWGLHSPNCVGRK